MDKDHPGQDGQRQQPPPQQQQPPQQQPPQQQPPQQQPPQQPGQDGVAPQQALQQVQIAQAVTVLNRDRQKMDCKLKGLNEVNGPEAQNIIKKILGVPEAEWSQMENIKVKVDAVPGKYANITVAGIREVLDQRELFIMTEADAQRFITKHNDKIVSRKNQKTVIRGIASLTHSANDAIIDCIPDSKKVKPGSTLITISGGKLFLMIFLPQVHKICENGVTYATRGSYLKGFVNREKPVILMCEKHDDSSELKGYYLNTGGVTSSTCANTQARYGVGHFRLLVPIACHPDITKTIQSAQFAGDVEALVRLFCEDLIFQPKSIQDIVDMAIESAELVYTTIFNITSLEDCIAVFAVATLYHHAGRSVRGFMVSDKYAEIWSDYLDVKDVVCTRFPTLHVGLLLALFIAEKEYESVQVSKPNIFDGYLITSSLVEEMDAVKCIALASWNLTELQAKDPVLIHGFGTKLVRLINSEGLYALDVIVSASAVRTGIICTIPARFVTELTQRITREEGIQMYGNLPAAVLCKRAMDQASKMAPNHMLVLSTVGSPFVSS